MVSETCFPLVWPAGWKRTKPRRRRIAEYRGEPGPTLLQAIVDLQRALERLGVDGTVISTNVMLNRYGEPADGRDNADDPGAAVYFTYQSQPCVLACDCWERPADNIVAIAKHLRALMRGARQLGVGSLKQAFAGYEGPPPPRAQSSVNWRRVFGLSEGEVVTVERVNAIYRTLAWKLHPDKQAGSHAAMSELNVARDAALRDIAA